MYFWTSRGKSVNQLVQKCFCQQIALTSQNNILCRKYNSLYLAKNYNITRTFLDTSRSSSVSQFLPLLTNMSSVVKSNYSTSNENKNPVPELSTKDKLKRAVKDYGATVMIFHISISLASLGFSYLVISSMLLLEGNCGGRSSPFPTLNVPRDLWDISRLDNHGVDVASLLDKIGFPSPNQITTGASTFVVAYAVHKLFAPIRISITLGCTPFIVRYLRRVGILKPPKPSAP